MDSRKRRGRWRQRPLAAMIAYEDGQRASADSSPSLLVAIASIYAEPLHWADHTAGAGAEHSHPVLGHRSLARTKRVHQLSREGSSVSRRFQV